MTQMVNVVARDLTEVAPRIFQAIKVEMRRGRGADLSVPQFRTLRFVQRNRDSSLSDLAEHLGLMLPSVSKLVDGLVKSGLLVRSESATDRRRLNLVLTTAGANIVDAARLNAQKSMEAYLAGLTQEQLSCIHQAMELLAPIFVTDSAGQEHHTEQK